MLDILIVKDFFSYDGLCICSFIIDIVKNEIIYFVVVLFKMVFGF